MSDCFLDIEGSSNFIAEAISTATADTLTPCKLLYVECNAQKKLCLGPSYFNSFVGCVWPLSTQHEKTTSTH